MVPFSAFFGGFEFRATHLDGRRKIAIYLAGPLVSAVLIASLFWVNGNADVELQAVSAALQNAMYGAAVQLLITMVPITYPGWMGSYAHVQSDGRRIMGLLQGK